MEKVNKKEKYFKSFPVELKQLKEHYRNNFDMDNPKKGQLITKLILKFLRFFLIKTSNNFAHKIGTFLGLTVYFFKVRKKVAMTNLDIVFKNKKTQFEKEKIYKKCLLNLGHFVINFIRLPYLSNDFWEKNIEIENPQLIMNAFKKNRGVIFLGAHIGMWDLACGKLGKSGFPTSLVGKSVKNPAVNHFVLETRLKMNFATFKNRNTLKNILKELKRGGGVVMAVDQDMNAHKGLYLNWLGHQAYSVASTAYVAKKTGSVVIPICMIQKNAERFILKCKEEIPWIENENHSKEIEINAQNHSNIVQEWIHEAPELWFWLHKRYKTQPNGSNPYKK